MRSIEDAQMIVAQTSGSAFFHQNCTWHYSAPDRRGVQPFQFSAHDVSNVIYIHHPFLPSDLPGYLWNETESYLKIDILVSNSHFMICIGHK